MRSLPFRLAVAAAMISLAGCAEQTTAAEPAPTKTPTSSAMPSEKADTIPPDLDPDLVRVGQALVDLARGVPDATLPADAPVIVLLGGKKTQVVDASDPTVWGELCGTEGEGYAERECPISALAPLADPVTFTTDPAQEPCSKPHGLQTNDVGATKRVTLVANSQGSCLDYAAVELYVNDVSQLVAVDVVLGSP